MRPPEILLVPDPVYPSNPPSSERRVAAIDTATRIVILMRELSPKLPRKELKRLFSSVVDNVSHTVDHQGHFFPRKVT